MERRGEEEEEYKRTRQTATAARVVGSKSNDAYKGQMIGCTVQHSERNETFAINSTGMQPLIFALALFFHITWHREERNYMYYVQNRKTPIFDTLHLLVIQDGILP